MVHNEKCAPLWCQAGRPVPRLRAEEQKRGGGNAGGRTRLLQKWRPCRAVVEKGALVQLFPCNARKSGVRNFSLSLSLSRAPARAQVRSTRRAQVRCTQLLTLSHSRARASANQIYATRASQVHAFRQPGVNLSEWYRILKTGQPKPLRGYKVGLSAQL